MINRSFKAIHTALCLAGLLVAGAAQAHPLWILPHEFSVSTETDKGEWVTFDVSASHTVFGFDKGVPLDSIRVYSPDGDQNRLGSYYKGQRRSVFDWYMDQSGTYRIEASRPPFYFTSYKSGKRDTPKRMMASKQQAKQRLPKNARDVSTLLIDIKTTTYITNNQPTELVTEVQGRGLEVRLLTHPNDIVAGEEVEFEMLLNGEPVAGVEVEVTPAGTKYRDERGAIQLRTGDDGMVVFTPEQAGPWLFAATLQTQLDSAAADAGRSTRYISFEAIAE